MLNRTGILLSNTLTNLYLYLYTSTTSFYSKDRFRTVSMPSHCEPQTNWKTNRINGLHTFCKVWTFKDHLISDYSNNCSSSSRHSPFSVSDKTSDESDTTTESSCVAAIIDYMHRRVWICNASCRHLESWWVTRLFHFIHDRWPCLSLDKLLYHIFSFDVTKEKMER